MRALLLLFFAALAADAASSAAAAATVVVPPAFLDPTNQNATAASSSSPSSSSFEGYLLTLFWPPTALPPAAQADAKFSILKGYAAPGMWSLGFSPFSAAAPLPTATGDASAVLPSGCAAGASSSPRSSSFPALSSADALASAAPGWNLSLSYYWSLRADHQRLAGDVPFWLSLWDPPMGGSSSSSSSSKSTSGGGGGACSGLEPLRYFMAAFAASAQARTLVEAAVLSPTGSNSSLGVVSAAEAEAEGAGGKSRNAAPLAVAVADAAASLGDALVPGSMLCVLPPGNSSSSVQQQQQQASQMRLAQLTLCVDRETLSPKACPASWRAQAESLRSAPSSSPPIPVGGALPTVTSAASAARGLSVAPGGVLASCLDDFVSAAAAAAAPSSQSAAPPPTTASLPRFTVASAKRLIPGLIRSQDPVAFQPLSVWYWTPAFLGMLLLCLGAAAGAAALASRAGLVPALFAPRWRSPGSGSGAGGGAEVAGRSGGTAVRVARNPDVLEPVVVRCERFDVKRWAEVAPALAAVVSDLPVGVGLKVRGEKQQEEEGVCVFFFLLFFYFFFFRSQTPLRSRKKNSSLVFLLPPLPSSSSNREG